MRYISLLLSAFLIAGSGLPPFPAWVDKEKLAACHEVLAGHPHVAGTEANFRVASFLADKLREFGWKVETHSYKVLISHPENVRVFITHPVKEVLANTEPALLQDPCSWDKNIFPGYNAYSPSADIEAEVVFANYGTEEDFRLLRQKGVEVKGKIVLVKYGKLYRGGKVLNAEKAGAAGVLFYLDPADGGYRKGDVWPEGPYMPPFALRRGSILLLPWDGDPLTPGRPALEEAKRLDWERLRDRPRIPAVPISYKDAVRILKFMKGKPAPARWQGALPLFYHLDGDVRVRIYLRMKNQPGRITDIVATLEGDGLEDEWVLAGCHYDAWTFGAKDPTGGSVVLLEAARLLAKAKRTGFALKRTVKIAFWDGEEMGLLGSTEWAEQFLKEIEKRLVVNINEDAAGGGRSFWASATPRFRAFLRRALERNCRELNLCMLPPKKKIGTITSGGSDYAATLYLAAVPAAAAGLSAPFGVYHTAYDDLCFFRKMLDPGYKNSAKLAAALASLLYQTANASFVPYDYGELAGFLKKYLKKNFPEEVYVRLLPVLDEMESKGRRLFSMLSKPVSVQLASKIDRILLSTNRELVAEGGIVKGSWFRNLIFARNPVNRYRSDILPGLVRCKGKPCMETQLQLLERRFKKINSLLERAIKLLQR